MTVLILGAGGLLGSAFVEASWSESVIEAERREVTEYGAGQIVRRSQAGLVINCAADTDVEGAEHDPAASRAANTVLPGLLAEACRDVGATLLHVSSTGCYGTGERRPYSEEDVPAPTTAHHRHKLEGEDRVRASGCEALILRTGWLFGGRPGQRKNFVWNRLLEAGSNLRMASDPFQVGNPTFVGDVVRQTVQLLGRRVRGTFNCVSRPAASRLDYVRAIVSASGLPCEVVATNTPFKRLARVSSNEAADNVRLEELGLDIMPAWTDALPRYVASLIDSEAWRYARIASEDRT